MASVRDSKDNKEDRELRRTSINRAFDRRFRQATVASLQIRLELDKLKVQFLTSSLSEKDINGIADNLQKALFNLSQTSAVLMHIRIYLEDLDFEKFSDSIETLSDKGKAFFENYGNVIEKLNKESDENVSATINGWQKQLIKLSIAHIDPDFFVAEIKIMLSHLAQNWINANNTSIRSGSLSQPQLFKEIKNNEKDIAHLYALLTAILGLPAKKNMHQNNTVKMLIILLKPKLTAYPETLSLAEITADMSEIFKGFSMEYQDSSPAFAAHLARLGKQYEPNVRESKLAP